MNRRDPEDTSGQHRRWIFTLNNYTDVEVDGLKKEKVFFSFLLFGKEVAPTTGTPHLQGYFELPKKKTLGGLKKYIFLKRGKCLSYNLKS